MYNQSWAAAGYTEAAFPSGMNAKVCMLGKAMVASEAKGPVLEGEWGETVGNRWLVTQVQLITATWEPKSSSAMNLQEGNSIQNGATGRQEEERGAW